MNKPQSNKDNLSNKEIEDLKRMPGFIKKSVTWCLRHGFSTAIFFKLIQNGMNPFQAKKFMTEKLTGLRTDSIIGNPLYYPDIWENEGNLRFQSTSAGLWNVYDFRKKFKKKIDSAYSSFGEGCNLAFFPIEDIVNSNSDTEIETPMDLFDFFNFDHVIHFNKFKIQEALDYGAIREVTYQEAYERIGKESLLKDVSNLGIEEKTVYQVTPKGNTLILVSGKGGDKTPPLPDAEKGKQGGYEPIYA